MPKRFEKGSEEAKAWAKKMKDAREAKKGDVEYQKKVSERKQMKKEDVSSKKAETISKEPKINVDIFGTDELILPEYFAVATKKGYKLVNPLTQERFLSTRGRKTPFKLTRKAVDGAIYIDNQTDPIPISLFAKKDRPKLEKMIADIEKESDKEPTAKPAINNVKNKMRGRPETLPKNIAYNAEQRAKKARAQKKKVELVIEEEPPILEEKEEEDEDEEYNIVKKILMELDRKEGRYGNDTDPFGFIKDYIINPKKEGKTKKKIVETAYKRFQEYPNTNYDILHSVVMKPLFLKLKKMKEEEIVITPKPKKATTPPTAKKPRGRPKGVSKYSNEEEKKRALNRLKYESNLKKRREKETPAQTLRRTKKELKDAQKLEKLQAKRIDEAPPFRPNPKPNIELVIDENEDDDEPFPFLVEGEGLKPNEIKSLLDASYQDKPASKIGDWELDEPLSTPTAVVYYNPITDEAVVAHRGTQGVTDWGNNIAYALGAYELTPRYREGKKVQDEAERKYGKKNISTLGHSQGAVLARKLGADTKEIINVNSPYLGENQPKNEYNIRSSSDVVSSSYAPVSAVKKVLFPKYSKKHDIKIKAETLNPLVEHSYDILDRLDQDKTIGVGAGLKPKKQRFAKGSQEAKDWGLKMKEARDKRLKK